MLTALHAAASRDDLARPSWRLHGLFGDRVGFLAMTV
jgi:proteic killer suppression protein